MPRASGKSARTSTPLDDVIRKVTRIFERRDLNYSQTAYVVKEVRRRLGLAPEAKAKKLPEIISSREADRLIKQAYHTAPVQGLIVKFLWMTMVRVGEVVVLRIADVHLDDDYAKIRSGKGSKDRLVVIPRPLSQELRSYVGNRSRGPVFLSQRRKAFTPRRIEQIVEQAAALAKIQTHVTPHTLRRSMATELLNRGVREEVVSTLLGHESTQTTREAYARLSIQTLAQEVNQVMNGKSA